MVTLKFFKHKKASQSTRVLSQNDISVDNYYLNVVTICEDIITLSGYVKTISFTNNKVTAKNNEILVIGILKHIVCWFKVRKITSTIHMQ